MAEYIAEVFGLIDSLAITGDRMTENDVILYALASLGEGYEAFVQNVTTRDKI